MENKKATSAAEKNKIRKKVIEFERLCKGTVNESWKVNDEYEGEEELYYVSEQGEDGYCRTVFVCGEWGDVRDLKFSAWAKNNQKLILKALTAYSK